VKIRVGLELNEGAYENCQLPKKRVLWSRNKHVNPVYRTTEFIDLLYFTQGVSWLVEITVGDDFVGLYN
jgi:hypothetical protein